jgi:cell division protein ZapE
MARSILKSTDVVASPLLARYQALQQSGDIEPDAAQDAAIILLDQFAQRLNGYDPARRGLLTRFLHAHPALPAGQAGLYLCGDVGRGKSMLMDLFFATVNVAKKRRVHFHQFMLEVQARLHRLQGLSTDEILPHLARDIAAETSLLCFDEFHVSNIADAMILGRLFESLFGAGVVIVTTSNWEPDKLYNNGLQRDRFQTFIDLIKRKMTIYYLAGTVDHRYEKLRGLTSYFSPLGQEATRQLQGLFLQLTDEAPPEKVILPVLGRSLKITHAAKGVGFFNFEELCVGALGAADYLAIAKCLHTVMLDGVPRFTAEQRNETLRFINLIDALYEAKVKFFMAAAAPADQLAPPGEHHFAFQRTVSRLMEMQSEEYLHKAHVMV